MASAVKVKDKYSALLGKRWYEGELTSAGWERKLHYNESIVLRVQKSNCTREWETLGSIRLG